MITGWSKKSSRWVLAGILPGFLSFFLSGLAAGVNPAWGQTGALPSSPAATGTVVTGKVELETVVRIPLEPVQSPVWRQAEAAARNQTGAGASSAPSGVSSQIDKVFETLLDGGELALAGGTLRPTLGRQAVSWGPGRFGQLTLGSATPLDWLLVDYSRSSLDYRQGVAALDWQDGRFLLARRWEWQGLLNATSRFQLGVTETASVRGSFPWRPEYFFPFVPQGFWQWLAGGEDGSAGEMNENLGLDASLELPGGGRLYGELFLDDPPYLAPGSGRGDTGGGRPEAGSSTWDRSAWLLGWQKNLVVNPGKAEGTQQIQVEYARTSPNVYKDTNPANSYYLNGQPLGFWLGPGSELLVVRVGWQGTRPVALPAWVFPLRFGMAVDREALEEAARRVAGNGQAGEEAEAQVARVPVKAVLAAGEPEGDQTTVSVQATVSTYGEVRFIRQAGEGQPVVPQQAGTSSEQQKVRISVGQSLNWRDMKVNVEVGVEHDRTGLGGSGQTSLVASVRISIPLAP